MRAVVCILYCLLVAACVVLAAARVKCGDVHNLAEGSAQRSVEPQKDGDGESSDFTDRLDPLIWEAQARHEAGDVGGSIDVLLQVHHLAPNRVDVLFSLGLMLMEQARWEDAKAAFHATLQRMPEHTDAMNNAGKCAAELGDLRGAVALYRAAIAHDPAHDMAHLNLAIELMSLGQLSEAWRELRAMQHNAKAVSERMSDAFLADVHFHAGLCGQRLGDILAAAADYQSALNVQPDHYKSRHNLASLHHRFGRVSMAVPEYQHLVQSLLARVLMTLQADPDATLSPAAAHIAQGGDTSLADLCAVLQQQEVHDAFAQNDLEHYWLLLTAANNLGVALMQTDDFETSRRLFSRVVLPQASRLQHSLEFAKQKEATDTFTQTLVYLLHNSRLSTVWQPGIADMLFERAQAAMAHPEQNLSTGLLPFDTLHMDVSLAWRRRLAVFVSDTMYPRAPDAMVSSGCEDPPAPAAAASAFDTPSPQLHVALLSHDFNDHPTAHLMEGLLMRLHRVSSRDIGAHNDAARDPVRALPSGLCHASALEPAVELGYKYAVSTLSYGKDDGSSFRHNFEALSDTFCDLAGAGFCEGAAAIRTLGVDIVFDLQGHTLGTRLEILAQSPRPAPIMVNYLIYPGTAGTWFHDYIIADQFVLPPEHAEHFTEHVVHMPRGTSYQINVFDPHRAALEATHSGARSLLASASTAQRAGLDQTHVAAAARRLWQANHELERRRKPSASIIFCNFNKVTKLDAMSMHAWANILRRVPRSELWLLDTSTRRQDTAGAGNASAYLADETVQGTIFANLAALGIPRARVQFLPRVPKAVHLARQEAADIFLDTFMYGAHSTATDALKGGVPLLTVAGPSFPARVGVSLLSTVIPAETSDGLLRADLFRQSLLCASIAQFEDTAKRLTRPHGALPELHWMLWHSSTLQEAGSGDHVSTLFNTAKYTANFVRASQQMREIQQLGRPRSRSTDSDSDSGDQCACAWMSRVGAACARQREESHPSAPCAMHIVV